MGIFAGQTVAFSTTFTNPGTGAAENVSSYTITGKLIGQEEQSDGSTTMLEISLSEDAASDTVNGVYVGLAAAADTANLKRGTASVQMKAVSGGVTLYSEIITTTVLAPLV